MHNAFMHQLQVSFKNLFKRSMRKLGADGSVCPHDQDDSLASFLFTVTNTNREEGFALAHGFRGFSPRPHGSIASEPW
jgi:hypothetical protein